jgi:mono/diheme cytochrome c family protein
LATSDAVPALPERLSETGLFVAGSRDTSPGVVTFTPQYPLWSDGSAKRRWLRLPPGTFIDAAQPDAWVFPPGTRLWKEFAHDGRGVETRFIERLPDGTWQFAAYVWNEDGRDAVLAPLRGATLPVAAAPAGRYVVPGRRDCLACHGGTAVPVLGVGALQLSPARDPLAPNRQSPGPGDVDLRELVARGWLRNLPPTLLEQPPRIAADTPVERAALGYLHGNCAHCHNTTGSQVPVSLTLAQSVTDPEASLRDVLRSALDAPTEYRPPGTADDHPAIVPGRPHDSVLTVRMKSRHPHVQMPPLGTQVPDPEGLALVHRWITQDLPHRKELRP